MDNDLISRNYVENIVKEEFVDLQDGTEEWRTYVNDTCVNILDKVHNAPTVDIVSPTINVNIPEKTKQELIEELQKPHKLFVLPEPENIEYPFYQEAYQTGYEEGRKDFERPKGKWISKHLWDNTHIWVCSECGNQNTHGITVEKACWKCGAQMKGGAE